MRTDSMKLSLRNVTYHESLLLSLVTYHYHLSLTTLTVTILKWLQLITGEFSEEYQK